MNKRKRALRNKTTILKITLSLLRCLIVVVLFAYLSDKGIGGNNPKAIGRECTHKSVVVADDEDDIQVFP